MKQLILITFSTLLGLGVNAQTNCGLINEITLKGDTNKRINQFVNVIRLNDSISNDRIQVPIDTNTWHHFALVKKADRTGIIYINGIKQAQGEFMDSSYFYNKLYIGAGFVSSWGDFFNGWIDELRVSNKVRSDSEISSSANAVSNLSADANTIGLWHFDETSGTNISNEVGNIGSLFNGVVFETGKFGNAVYFDGIDDRGDCNLDMPEQDITIEFWGKLDGATSGNMVVPSGTYNTEISVNFTNKKPNYTWSTGDTTSSITVDPSTLSSVWVNNGNCTDTIFFGGKTVTNYVTDTTFMTFNDTNYVDVYDSLIVDLTGEATSTNTPFDNNLQVKIYPNPASEKLILEVLDAQTTSTYSYDLYKVNGQAIILNGTLNNNSTEIDLSSYSSGTYYIRFYDENQVKVNQAPIVIQK